MNCPSLAKSAGIVLGAGALLVLAPGCSPSSADSKMSSAAAITNTFTNADPVSRDLAASGVAALNEADLPAALQRFKSLTERQDLTDEQRRAASQAFGNALQQVSKAARNGDARAQEALKTYMLTK